MVNADRKTDIQDAGSAGSPPIDARLIAQIAHELRTPLAFPRVVWTFLLPSMYFIGYPLTLVVSGMITMYIIYMFVDGLYMVVAYLLANDLNRRRIRRIWWLFTFLPAFRWTLFWFRFGGFLEVLTESKSWRVRDPWTESALGVQRVGTTTLTFLTQSFLPRITSILGGILRTR